MQTKHIKKIAVTLAACAALALGARPAVAQNRPVTDLRTAFASVDFQRLFTEYKGRQEAIQQINTFGQGLDRTLQRLQSVNAVFLPEGEARELTGLYEKANPSDAEKNRITALEAKSQGAADELTRLQNVSMLNDQQRARLTELTTARQRGSEALQRVQQEYEGRLKQREAELNQKMDTEIKAAVSRVAQEKNFVVVFSSAVAIYTANDITADVIKQLNK